ncbi:MAG: hypothetical protein MUQ65_07955, partial [Armatimonadetes bacterium]|nr:hypothetical protein [Armatimonadota bacterium]
VAALAALFVAANLLCMNDDQAQSHGNLLLDPQKQICVIDWGHPFCWIPDSVNDWSAPTLMRRVECLGPVARRLLDIPEVRELVPSVADRASRIPEVVIGEAFRGIPEAWRSPHEGGVSNSDCEAAQAFLLARKGRIVALISDIL